MATYKKFKDFIDMLEEGSKLNLILLGKPSDCIKVLDIGFLKDINALAYCQWALELCAVASDYNLNMVSIDSIIEGDDAYDILLCSNVEDDAYRLLDKVNGTIYSFFDDIQIITKGYFNIGSDIFIVNINGYILSTSFDALCSANETVENFTREYYFEIVRQSNKIITTSDDNGNVVLKNFSGSYINCENGMRYIEYRQEEYLKQLHIFGDSRMVGVFCEDKFTIPNLLQWNIDKKGFNYKVINHSVLYRQIERMIYQLKRSHINKGDIVFLASSFKGIDVTKEDALVFFEYLKEAKLYCEKLEAKFIYINLPLPLEIWNKSEFEKKLVSIDKEMIKRGNKKYNIEKYIHLKNILKAKCRLNDICFFDLREVLEQGRDGCELYVDPVHLGTNANRIVTKAMFEIISIEEDANNINENRNVIKQKEYMDSQFKNTMFNTSNRMEMVNFASFLSKYKQTVENAGCIVMNCNPFTNGHLYLIEHAAEKVPWLYIFVVQENRSFFSFEDRFRLVQEGTKHLKNVTVIPSGEFLVSILTFGEYFNRYNSEPVNVDASNDILTFTNIVAPTLNITKRFLGKEPFCNVTRQYNERIKKFCAYYNIEVCEIERVKVDDIEISASKVRELLQAKNFDLLERLVPKTTFKFLEENYG